MPFSREDFPDSTVSSFPLITLVLHHCVLLVSCTAIMFICLFVGFLSLTQIVRSEDRERNCFSQWSVPGAKDSSPSKWVKFMPNCKGRERAWERGPALLVTSLAVPCSQIGPVEPSPQCPRLRWSRAWLWFNFVFAKLIALESNRSSSLPKSTRNKGCDTWLSLHNSGLGRKGQEGHVSKAAEQWIWKTGSKQAPGAWVEAV